MRGMDLEVLLSRLLIMIVAAAVLFLGAGHAQARWPTPAGGTSGSGDPEVLFTFDDGPHEKHSTAILDELDRRGIRAIFFWVGRRLEKGGQAERRREVVQRAVRDGHLIANHTLTHANLCSVPAEQAAQEIDSNTRLYEVVTGLPMLLFRAPYGAHCKRLERMLAERALGHMHWDIDPQEWTDHDAERTARYIIKRLERLEGRAIVILHDTHLVTVRALPRILDWIEKENARRVERGGKRPIRIISGSDLVVEKLMTAMWSWAADATRSSAMQVHAAFGRLVP
jgi:peptidoglycan/xylan/chitin deacetylase (PgdA/CDA1 family)